MSVYIIAEAGVNHNGDLETAKKMIDSAKQAGADCVKFQTFISENIVSKHADKADYQKINTNSTENQLEMLRRLELSFDQFRELSEYCNFQGIDFMSTAFDMESIKFLDTLKMETWKIPSGDITNLPYLIEIAKLNKPIILSTGMSTLKEIEEALTVLKEYNSNLITVLHCTTEYPAPYDEVNLEAMNTIKEKFDVTVGYSDHTEGIEIPIAAVAMGAKVIEKHFTLDRSMQGPDHQASIEPQELESMVKAIRNVESAIGDGVKQPVASEKVNKDIARKSIIANDYIKKGTVFSEENLIVKRPGNGINPMQWFDVIGEKAIRDFDKDELIEL